jgi:hypothetical protein
LTRQALNHVLNDPASNKDEELQQRLTQIQEMMKKPNLTDELRKSVSGQAEILQQRIEKRQEARAKIDFLQSELTRIEEQAELLREQAVLTTDPELISQRIDQVAATLGGTSQWIREQQQIYGAVEDLLVEAPPAGLTQDVPPPDSPLLASPEPVTQKPRPIPARKVKESQ